jgi:hypothetical protein
MRETYFASACIQNRAHRLLSDLKRHMASDLLLVSVFTDNSAWSCFGASTVPVQDAASIYRVFSQTVPRVQQSKMKINIANPATGAQKLIDIEDERRV